MTADLAGVHPSATIHPSARLEVKRLLAGPGVVIGAGACVQGGDVELGAGARIGDAASVRAERLSLGHGARVGDRVTIAAIGGAADEVTLGDHSVIHQDGTVLLPVLRVGDYVAIHKQALINGYKPCVIGHNTWIGQNCVLNSTDVLTIGNNVGIGAYSSVYTHAFNGELLEGCNVFNVAPVVIEDNVWIVGAYNVISPGVTIGARSMVLTSSVVSRDVPALHCVGGVPARDLTDRIKPFRDVPATEKLALMRRFVAEFIAERHATAEQIEDGFRFVEDGASREVLVVEDYAGGAGAAAEAAAVYCLHDHSEPGQPHVTSFEIASKTYVKRRTALEFELIRFMNGYRARFAPRDYPRVALPAMP